MPTECPAADGSSPKTQRFKGPPPMCIDPEKTYTATMETTKGTMMIALDPIAAPKTVNNFVVLARYHYYDGVSFHRIIPGFVIQGGDPEGTGRGGPGYKFEDELPKRRPLRDRLAGHGQRRSQHQRQPVLHHLRPPRGAACRPATPCSARSSPASTWCRPSTPSARPAPGTPKEKVGMISVTISEE